MTVPSGNAARRRRALRNVKRTERRRNRHVGRTDISRGTFDDMASYEPMRRRIRAVGDDA